MEPLENCIFCQIAAKKVPAQVEYEDANTICVWDIEPKAPTHLLVLTKKHIASLDASAEADDEDLMHLITTAREVAKRKGLGKEGYRFIINSGINAGQTVDHLHAHILAGGNLGTMTSVKNDVE